MDKKNKRPLSPHISVYRWILTSTLSILHRLSGVIIYFWLLILAILFILISYNGIESLSNLNCFYCFLMKFILIGGLLPFVYHFWNGMKYLFFDFKRNVNNISINQSAVFVLSATVISYGLIIWKVLF